MKRLTLILLLGALTLSSCKKNHLDRPKNLKTLLKMMPKNMRLHIDTPDGSDQSVHPDVLYSKGKIILAATPYPGYNDQLENPCLYKSYTGKWYVDYEPGINPLVGAPKFDHNCDPDIFFDDKGELCLYYLENLRPKKNNMILLKKDATGKFKKRTVLSYDLKKGEPFILSPAYILTYKSEHRLYFVNVSKKNKRVQYIPSTKLHTWDKSKTQTLDLTLPKNYTSWHVDVLKDEGRYYMLLNGYYGKASDNNYSVLLYESVDGVNWNYKKKLVDNDNIPDGKVKHVYRSSALKSGDILGVWYSYVTKKNKWRIAFKKIKL